MRRWARTRATGVTAAGGLVLFGVLAAGSVLPGGDVAPAVVETSVEASGPASASAAAPAESPVWAAEAESAMEPVVEPEVLERFTGGASYYANALAGRRTASGVPYRPRSLVAAHRTLPFGTRLRVENLTNGRTVEVEVVDRGPFARGRVLDLSRRAAEELGFIRQGHTRVRIEVLEYGEG